ncbi:hypothetical protein HYV22_03235 [Candidatus Gottesmanbacteria bacterium]|nr:hypothetical protein [Candidatus Gottesmanbacteria bacterium]
MTIPNIALWAKRKGIGLVATGDWTHPLWMREIKASLEEVGNGLLALRAEVASKNLDPGFSLSREQSPTNIDIHRRSQSESGQNFSGSPHANIPLFLLATEVSCIYSQAGRVRRVHTLIWVPSLASADNINKEMTRRGCNLMSDGRPIIGLTSIQVAELVFSVEPNALIIPAHAWTPWFSVYGSLGGFDSLEEAFGPFAKNIYAIETGLSSNPAMNWRIRELDHRSIVSFSDAHSGPKLGREATVFELSELSYEAIRTAIIGKQGVNKQKLDVGSGKLDREVRSQKLDQTSNFQSQNPISNFPSPTSHSIAFTIEFYPEEGKYHYTGHRACNIRLSPEETKKKGVACPVCGKPLTQGVMQRVEELAGRSEEELQIELRFTNYELREKKTQIQVTGSKTFPNRPPFVMLVPLQEIIAESIGSPVASPKVQGPYQTLTDALGGEFNVLLSVSISDITKAAGERVAQGIEKVRRGDIVIDPGYDGVFGVVKIWKEGEEKPLLDSSKEQLSMF